MRRLGSVHGAKAKLLSQGLEFLYDYVRNNEVDVRADNVERLLGVADDFIVAALHSIWQSSIRALVARWGQ